MMDADAMTTKRRLRRQRGKQRAYAAAMRRLNASVAWSREGAPVGREYGAEGFREVLGIDNFTEDDAGAVRNAEYAAEDAADVATYDARIAELGDDYGRRQLARRGTVSRNVKLD